MEDADLVEALNSIETLSSGDAEWVDRFTEAFEEYKSLTDRQREVAEKILQRYS